MQARALFLSLMVVSSRFRDASAKPRSSKRLRSWSRRTARLRHRPQRRFPRYDALDMTFQFSSVGETGKEPSIGITSSGCIFFIAMEKVMRSCDGGLTWEETQDPVMCSPTTSDPYGWVDPITDRVFGVQMIGLETSWICWSDDDGETWMGNPHDSGTTPLNDHIKLASGPWTDSGYGALGQFTGSFYETAVYYCYNKLAGIFCFTSFDGGATFETGGQIIGLATTNGGLHGAISTAPDGTVYVTRALAPPPSSFRRTTVSRGLSARWGRTSSPQTLEKTPRSPPTRLPTLTTFGPEPTRASTCQDPRTPVRRGKKKAFEFRPSRLFLRCSHRPMRATRAASPSPILAAKTLRCSTSPTSMVTLGRQRSLRSQQRNLSPVHHLQPQRSGRRAGVSHLSGHRRPGSGGVHLLEFRGLSRHRRVEPEFARFQRPSHRSRRVASTWPLQTDARAIAPPTKTPRQPTLATAAARCTTLRAARASTKGSAQWRRLSTSDSVKQRAGLVPCADSTSNRAGLFEPRTASRGA